MGPRLLVTGQAGVRIMNAEGAVVRTLTSQPVYGMTACGSDGGAVIAELHRVGCVAPDGQVTFGQLGSVSGVCGEPSGDPCIVREARSHGDLVCFNVSDRAPASVTGSEWKAVSSACTVRTVPESLCGEAQAANELEGARLLPKSCALDLHGSRVSLGPGAPCEMKLNGMSPSGAHMAVSIAVGSGDLKYWMVRIIDVHHRKPLPVETRVADGETVAWAPVPQTENRAGHKDTLLAGSHLVRVDPPKVIALAGSACWLR
jgi:hypothetical protein